MANLDIKKTLKTIKLHESTISMLLGALVIVISGVLLLNFFAGRRGGKTIPPIETIDEVSSLPTKHIVATGEDLWKISEKYYGTGYNWVDIAKENNIEDPNEVRVGQSLTIPKVEPKLTQGKTLKPTPSISQLPITEQPTLSPTPKASQERPLKVGKTVHKVESGESLWKIAEKYYDSGYNWVDIAKENDLKNPGLIETNQELTIPELDSKTSTVRKTVKNEPISGTNYTVKKGDSLWSIAVRAYGDGYKWIEIAKVNNLSHPNLIHPENTLSLPR